MNYQEYSRESRDRRLVRPTAARDVESERSGFKSALVFLALLILVLVLFALTSDYDRSLVVESHDQQAKPLTFVARAHRTANVTSGVATLRHDQEFCFSLGKAVAEAGDLRFSSYPPTLRSEGAICLVGGWDLDDVNTAPERDGRFFMLQIAAPKPRPQRYHGFQSLNVGDCYVVVCADEVHYAKIRVMELDVSDPRKPTLTFQWAYQPDGTRTFQSR